MKCLIGFFFAIVRPTNPVQDAMTACTNSLKSLQEKGEGKTFVDLHCTSITAKLKLLPALDQFDALHEIDIVYRYTREVTAAEADV